MLFSITFSCHRSNSLNELILGALKYMSTQNLQKVDMNRNMLKWVNNFLRKNDKNVILSVFSRLKLGEYFEI